MYRLCREFEFSFAHHLTGYRGKCERLHGHNYKCQVYFESEYLDSPDYPDMLMDFGKVKELFLNSVDKKYDHHCSDEYNMPHPTAEFMAKDIFSIMSTELENLKVKSGIYAYNKVRLYKVRLWESSDTFAEYLGE